MPKKRFSAEQIVTLLCQIEVSMSQGKAAPVACYAVWLSEGKIGPSPVQTAADFVPPPSTP